MEHTTLKLPNLNFSKEVKNYYPEILTDEALNFITALHEKFNARKTIPFRKTRKSAKGF